EYRGVSMRIRAKREAIEYELPRLVSAIDKTLKHNRDVLNILENYRKNAGSELKHELDITVADMRSGNYESALTRLESRVGSSMMSDVCRGLIGVLRGDDTAVYWASLTVKFADIQRQLLRMRAQKIPRKVKRLSMCLLFCFMLIYVVVICVEIMSSLGVLFG
ncbi:MAG: secretion protein F, partial [Eubacteriales bacterium]|nr:secretion protein F [Eubacteriales bacterium]